MNGPFSIAILNYQRVPFMDQFSVVFPKVHVDFSGEYAMMVYLLSSQPWSSPSAISPKKIVSQRP